MENLFGHAAVISFCAGLWAVVNGILHDVFVIRKYRKYDRELLRLLMDGHVLITCGIIQLISSNGLKQNVTSAAWISGVATLSLLVYCGMIFPFLKSPVTIGLNAILLLSLIFGSLL